MRLPRPRFTVRRLMAAVGISALVFALVYFNSVGSFYGPGGQRDREYSQAEREWRLAHPAQAYPSLAPTTLAP